MESYFNDEGMPRVHVVANLGRIDTMKDGQLDALIRGLSRVAGRPEPGRLEILYEDANGFGDVLAHLIHRIGHGRRPRRLIGAM